MDIPIRELARQIGGDTLVDKVDETNALERKISEQLHKLHNATLDANPEEQANVAMCEALSHAYSVAACLIGEMKHVKVEDRSEILVLAIRSLTGNMERVWAAIDAKKEGISDLIKDAAKRGGE